MTDISNYKNVSLPNDTYNKIEKIRKVMIRGQRFGEGPDAADYMDDIPENIKKRIRRAEQKGIDIKIDTIISKDGTKES